MEQPAGLQLFEFEKHLENVVKFSAIKTHVCTCKALAVNTTSELAESYDHHRLQT